MQCQTNKQSLQFNKTRCTTYLCFTVPSSKSTFNPQSRHARKIQDGIGQPFVKVGHQSWAQRNSSKSVAMIATDLQSTIRTNTFNSRQFRESFSSYDNPQLRLEYRVHIQNTSCFELMQLARPFHDVRTRPVYVIVPCVRDYSPSASRAVTVVFGFEISIF